MVVRMMKHWYLSTLIASADNLLVALFRMTHSLLGWFEHHLQAIMRNIHVMWQIKLLRFAWSWSMIG